MAYNPPPSPRGRRSWFDAPPLTSLNCPDDNGSQQACAHPTKKKRSLDSVENLTLTHFTTPPRIGFGTVVLGKTKVRTLLIRNPHDYEQEVIVERFPYKKKFTIEVNRFTVQPSEVFSLEIFWTPEEAGGVREMIQFYINDVYRLQAFLFGSAEQPKQVNRRRRKNFLGPKIKQQPQNVLQTPALANIKSSYSPRRSEEAMWRLEEADKMDREKDKENSGDFNIISTAKGSVHSISKTKDHLLSSPVKHAMNENPIAKYSDHKVGITPTPLESTTIMPRQENEVVSSVSKGRKQWKGISDGSSAILNTMSPILINEGNEHGFTVDSFCQPIDTSVLKEAMVNSTKVMQKGERLSETFAKPQIPLNTGNLTKSKYSDRRSTATLPSSAFTSSVGKLLHPDLITVEGNKLPQRDATCQAESASLLGHASSVLPKALGITEIIHTSPKSPLKPSPRTTVLSPQTPTTQRQSLGERFSQASPNTMLNESLSLISNMKMPNLSGNLTDGCESGSSSPNENNVSLSCSIISQGCGMVSPDSFMEDMRNASINFGHGGYLETNDTSTPNLPGSMDDGSRQNNSLNTSSASISRTPNKPRPPSSRFGTKRRSFTSQFEREQMKRVAAAVMVVKHDKTGFESITQTSGKAVNPKNEKVIKVQKSTAGFSRNQSPGVKSKRATTKKNSPPRQRSPTKRLRKEILKKQIKAKSTAQNKTCRNHVNPTAEGENIVTTPDSKHNRCDSHTVTKSRSFESNTVTKSKLEDSNNQSKYFPDIFTNDNDPAKESHPTRRQLCPDKENSQDATEALSNHNIDHAAERPQSEDLREIKGNEEATFVYQNKFDRAVAAVERIPSSPLASPKHFQTMSPTNLPTSPSVDGNRRTTLTVTKSRPSDALLAAMKNRKRLFEKATIQSEQLKPTDVEGCEMHENIEVIVKESYEEREGKVYVVVKETTSVTKSTTDTYVDQVSVEVAGVSPGQFQTPTRLPSSPNPQLSRRSTHVLHSPKIIDKAGLKTNRLEFEGEQDGLPISCQENSRTEEDEVDLDGVLSKTKSDTFEKEPTILVDSMQLSKSTKSNTFEKESSALLETIETKSETSKKDLKEDCLNWGDDEPITAVCATRTSLVDYEDIVSEDGGSSGNLTKDSLDVTTQSEDSLDKSKASELATKGQPSDDEEKSSKECHIELRPTDCKTDLKELTETVDKAENSSRQDHGELDVLQTESDGEEDKFYDTLSQRYYDALSDTRDEDLDDELTNISDKEEEAVNNNGGASVISDPEMEEIVQPSSNPILCHQENSVFDNGSVDRKEKFLTEYKQVLDIKEKGEGVSLTSAIPHHQKQSCKTKSNLRRSLSATQIDQPVSFSVDISDCKKSSTVKESKESSTKKSTPTMDVRDPVKSQQQVFMKPTNQPKARGRSTDMAESKQRSQSLSNLQKIKDKKTYEKPVEVKTSAKPASGAVLKKKPKGVPQSRLILLKKTKSGAPRHPMPFAARNMYYDERWMEKQERGFVQWLNFVLTPPDEYVAATNKAKVNAGSLSLETQQVKPQLAPTKEVLSFRAYAARRRLNRLRRQACQMYQSDAVVSVIRKVEVEVESRRIAMRKDKKAHADLGIKQRMLDLLLQYSSLWLRVGLETIFGEILMLQSNQDILGLSRFIVTRLLSSPDIAAEFAHPTVPHLYKDGYADAASRHTVKKFLLLVYFLDYAKTNHLIEHDPCLFCKDAEIKSSKEILIQFSREVLSGEGDITRHLAYLGYKVSQSQRPIDEFDFAVRNLSSDLRDGLRLSRMMEFMTNEQGIMGRLRTPAISRLQKVHNMEEFFKSTQKQGLDLSTSGVSAKDVVDGHREKTLTLLWRIMLHFQSCIQVNEAALQEEINLLSKSLQLKLAMQKIGVISMIDCKASRDSGAGNMENLIDGNARLALIFQWCRLVCLHYGVKVDNFTVSFSDGRALCCLLHHYHPALLPQDLIKFQTSVSHQEAAEEREEQEQKMRLRRNPDEDDADDSIDWGVSGGGLLPGENDPDVYDRLLGNEKSNFKVLYEKVSALGGVPLMVKFTDMSNTIPDEKVVSTYVSYLCARLLDIREEVRAARLIQMAWRRCLLRRAVRERQKQTTAALTIQRWIRPILRKRLTAGQEKAAVVIQAWVRSYLSRKKLLKQQNACLLIQSHWRRFLAMRQLSTLQLDRDTKAVSVIAIHVKGFLARKKFFALKKSAILLQSLWRMYKAQRELSTLRRERNDKAATVIAKYVKGYIAWKKFSTLKKSAILVQSLWRMHKTQTELSVLRLARKQKASIVIAKTLKGFVARKKFCSLKKSAITIQGLWRVHLAKRELSALRLERNEKASIVIAKYVKGYMARKKFSTLKKSAILLQSLWRMHRAQRELSALRLERDEKAATFIAKLMKGYVARKKFSTLKSAAIQIQSLWRMHRAQWKLSALRLERDEKAATLIAKHMKGYVARKKFSTLKSSAIQIQSLWRMYRAQRELSALRLERDEVAATLIAKHMKGYVARKKFSTLKNAAIQIQSLWRMYRAQRELSALRLERDEVAATLIAKHMKGYVARKKFSTLKNAAIQIQSFWRMHTAQRELSRLKHAREDACSVIVQKTLKTYCKRRRFLQLKHATVVLQSAWRAKKARQEVALLKEQRLIQASVVIQKNFKAFNARQRYSKLRKSTIIIQKNWRMSLAKKVVKRLKEDKRERAAVVLQKHYRCFQKRAEFSKLRQATVTIQSRWRVILAQRLLAELKLQQQTQAATLIQTVWRGWWVRQSYCRQRSSAVCIQSFWRMYCSRQEYLKKKYAASIIQSWHRANMEADHQRKAYLKLRQSAVVLQSAWRGKLQRFQFLKARKAAIVIQSRFRGHRRRLKFLALRLACVIIQRQYRALMEGKKQRLDYKHKVQAAICIQNYFRKIQKQRQIRRTAAALLLQTVWRKVQAQQAFRSKKSATVVIQQRFRACYAAKACRNEFLTMKKAAMTIQLAFRAHMVKKRYAKLLQAATTVQACVRRNQAHRVFFEKQRALLVIQRKYRANKLGRVFRQAFLLIRNSAIKIQRFFRAVQQRRKAQAMLALQRNSATRIQAIYRSYRLRNRYLSLKEATVSIQQRYRSLRIGREKRTIYMRTRWAAKAVQIWWRSCLKVKEARTLLEMRRKEVEAERVKRLEEEKLEQQRKEEEQKLQMEREAEEKKIELERWAEQRRRDRAVRILQRSWRGYLVMQDFLMRENAAVLIQTHVRGFLVRQAYKRTMASVVYLQLIIKGWIYERQFERAEAAARIIQTRWRDSQASRRLRKEYLKFREAVVKLQALWRMKSQRQSFKRQIRLLIYLQAQAKMCLQRKKYIQLKENTTFLQHRVRAYQAMRRERSAFLKLTHSAIKIQSVVRLWLAFKATQRQEAAVKIQAYWRMYQQRVAFKQEYEAAQVIKSFMLMKQQQMLNRARHGAVTIIQRAFRSFLQQRELKRFQAALIIQQWYRSCQIQRAEKQNSAAVVVVNTLRRVIALKRRERSKSAIVIQSVVRMFFERQKFFMLRRSVVVLQAAVRGHMAKRRVASLRARHVAATTIQAAVRGFLVRRKLEPILHEKIQAAQEHRVLQISATKIQAWWRGYMQRRVSKKKMVQTRRRLEKVNLFATKDKTLAARTDSALDYLLKERDLARTLESLMHLETATRLSSVCCERIVAANGVQVLYRLINGCNRSIPHMDLIKYSISILLNLAKYEMTIQAVLEPEECIGTLLDLIQIYRDKGVIFYKSCMLLGILGLDPRMRAHILTFPKIIERLDSIRVLVLRKEKVAQTRQTTLQKMAAMRTNCNCTLPVMTPRRRPRVLPSWSMARGAMKEFEDPTTAINFVLSCLKC